MPITNIMCSICTDMFKNSDDVHSTSCGHLFHLSCLNTWQVRQRNCPQCRYYNPITYKIHLTFDESDKISETVDDIEIKLANANDEIAQLEKQIKEQRTQYSQLRKQINIANNSNGKLNEELNTIKDMESEFLHLQAQYTVSSELRKELEGKINDLVVRNESKAQELKNKILENNSIIAKIESQQDHLTDGIHNEKIKILEHKIKHFSDEFDNEIKLSTKLSIENMQLQSRVKLLQNSL